MAENSVRHKFKNMSNQFCANFFRKDLNLGGRWWHRLFLVIFFVCFAWALYAMSKDLFADNHSYVPQWKVVDSVDERLIPEVKQIRDLKKFGEQVEEKDRSYALNLRADSIYDDFYCSADLENKILNVQSQSGITNLYLNRKNVSMEVFVNYVRDNDIKCLIPDAYTSSDNTKLRFLEPLGPNSLYGKDLAFYEKSNFLTAFYVLKMLLLVIAIFFGIAIAYYKIFLYIIFGKKKDI
jgi:hypothetical protein